MATMAFAIAGAGYGRVNYGGIDIIIRSSGRLLMYKTSGFGSRGPGAFAELSSASPIQIPDGAILNNFVGQVVRLTVGAASGIGVYTDLSLKIQYSGGNHAIVYDTGTLPVRVNGFLVSKLEFEGTMRLEPIRMNNVPFLIQMP